MAEIPPLEDVPELLNKINLKEKKPSTTLNSCDKKSDLPFAGMKKGFLCQSPKQPSKKAEKKKDNEELPFIKKQPNTSNLVIKEVQDAFQPNSSSEFQDLLSSKLESNPDVSDILSDPTWIGILDEFQKDSLKAMIKYQNNPEVQRKMKFLCSVFGDTFLHMESTNKSEDEILSQKMLENPKLKDALTDPYIESIMDHMKKGENDKVQRMLQAASDSQKEKIKLLVDFGLFSFVT